MPHYEFFCHACKKTFTKILALVEYEKERVACPHCGSRRVEQGCSAFSVITSKKSAWELSPSTAPKVVIDTNALRA